VTTVLYLALLIFSGVNFPVEVLPKALQWVSQSIPLTRGIAAARGAMAGGDWASIQALLAGELLVGMIYIGVGYLLFSWFEKLSLVDGQIEAM
jgi:ABC-type polysaccharide/polyol phosphate export permease